MPPGRFANRVMILQGEVEGASHAPVRPHRVVQNTVLLRPIVFHMIWRFWRLRTHTHSRGRGINFNSPPWLPFPEQLLHTHLERGATPQRCNGGGGLTHLTRRHGRAVWPTPRWSLL